MACWRHCGLCLAAGVTEPKATVKQHLYGLQLAGWPHLLVLPWPGAFLNGYVGMTPLAMDTKVSLPPSRGLKHIGRVPLGRPLGLPDWPGFQGLKLLLGLLAAVIIFLLCYILARTDTRSLPHLLLKHYRCTACY